MAKITIFGLAGTGTSTVGKMLAEDLGYEFKSSGNIFRALAEELKISLSELEEKSKTDDSYDRELDRKVAEFGKNNDNFVFESRLAWYFIPDSFKINIFCDFDIRVSRVAIREGKDFLLAKKETEERESAIFDRYNRYYGISDISNPNNFNISIDSSKNNAKEVLNLIKKALKIYNIFPQGLFFYTFMVI